MKELLDFVSEHNFLKMGDYHFSPIMVSSSGICLEYCKKINESIFMLSRKEKRLTLDFRYYINELLF